MQIRRSTALAGLSYLAPFSPGGLWTGTALENLGDKKAIAKPESKPEEMIEQTGNLTIAQARGAQRSFPDGTCFLIHPAVLKDRSQVPRWEVTPIVRSGSATLGVPSSGRIGKSSFKAVSQSVRIPSRCGFDADPVVYRSL